jgi:hypothetical protein
MPAEARPQQGGEKKEKPQKTSALDCAIRRIVEPWVADEVGKALGGIPKEVWHAGELHALMTAVIVVHLNPEKAHEYEKDENLSGYRELIKEVLRQLATFRNDCSRDDKVPCDLVLVTATIKTGLPKGMKERKMTFSRNYLARESSREDQASNDGSNKDETRVVSAEPSVSLNTVLQFEGDNKEFQAEYEFAFLVFKKGKWQLCKKMIALQCEAFNKRWKIKTDLK